MDNESYKNIGSTMGSCVNVEFISSLKIYISSIQEYKNKRGVIFKTTDWYTENNNLN